MAIEKASKIQITKY